MFNHKQTTKTYFVGTQIMDKEIITILSSIFLFSGPMHDKQHAVFSKSSCSNINPGQKIACIKQKQHNHANNQIICTMCKIIEKALTK